VKRDAALVKALAIGAGAAALGLGVWLGSTWALLASTLTTEERAGAQALLGPRVALLVMMAAVGVAAVAAAVQWFYRRHVAAPAQLLEQARVLVDTDAKLQLQGQGSAAVQGLAAAFNELVAQREQGRAEMGARVAEASRGIEQERSRLAALMAELTQSVVVCNLDGRVLLYNQRARLQFKALSADPALAGGAELIGLGRSIHTVLEPALLAHALDNIRQRLGRGAASPSAQFVTVTRGGQLLRVQMAAVRDDTAAAATPTLGGYVLVLDNITRDYERDSAQDLLLQDLTEGSRGALGNLQAAVELLASPGLDAEQRERFLGVVRDEARQMAARLNDAAARNTQQSRTRWPLEDMLGSDLVTAALRRIGLATGLHASPLEVEAAVWLRLDSFALLQALTHLAGRLAEDFDVRILQLRLQRAGPRAQLDLVWPSLPLSTETVMAWEGEGMRLQRGGSELSPLSVRDVVQRHGGEFWFEHDPARQQHFFRFLLPLAAGGEAEAAAREAPALSASDSRPEYYDFDLFGTSESTHALDDQPLAGLRFTVFDTETTGLAPQQGDEIIQIGAVRVVNGRLLRQETFDQLVDPQRSIPAAGIPIHGITPERVQGQPPITRVLPAFHAFAADTVLVAHNAAFDMRFLQLKEAATGLRFNQPVLDTLLLSAVVHPQQQSHRLEAIAERFGVAVVGRHTALGDALVTAEVLLKLLPLLAAQGIHTLGQARAAAQQTYYARLKY